MYSKSEAAFLILKDYGKPLHVKEIVRIAISKNMIETKGKTPELTLTADLLKENKRRIKRGRNLRFCHVGLGIWGLAEWGLAPIKVKAYKPKRKGKGEG